MPDMTMCATKNCPRRDSCYRYKAKPDYLQSWSMLDTRCNEKSNFCYYIKYEETE